MFVTEYFISEPEELEHKGTVIQKSNLQMYMINQDVFGVQILIL